MRHAIKNPSPEARSKWLLRSCALAYIDNDKRRSLLRIQGGSAMTYKLLAQLYPAWKILVVILLFISPLFAQEQAENRFQSAAERFFARNDKNKDGKLSREEFPERQRRLFERIDTDKDGFVTLEEDIFYRNNRRRNTVNIPEGVTVHRDLIYGRVGERELPLDLYLPPDTSSPVPVVIWVHGGGW
ncbi:MAG: hypothetical protein F4W91_16015, partial [Gemmatimonadetes bacterium]|nr:hypothetical protein [Gemmatimonadota bacterium]